MLHILKPHETLSYSYMHGNNNSNLYLYHEFPVVYSIQNPKHYDYINYVLLFAIFAYVLYRQTYFLSANKVYPIRPKTNMHIYIYEYAEVNHVKKYITTS